LILVTIGVLSLIHKGGRGPGFIFILVGGLIYIKKIGLISGDLMKYFWPGVLILIGILIILRRKSYGKCEEWSDEHDKNPDVEGNNDILDEIAIFGGSDKIIHSNNFKGGKITAIFGGSNLNFLRVKLSKGSPVIDVVAIFGGMKLIVPEEWNVRIEVVSIFGGFSDKHKIKPADSAEKNQLIIKGLVIFGGGEIKSY
jgi:predicted membrane protein